MLRSVLKRPTLLNEFNKVARSMRTFSAAAIVRNQYFLSNTTSLSLKINNCISQNFYFLNHVQRAYSSSLPDHQVLLMPALSPTMEKGNLLSWKKNIGDEISAGEVLAEIETDKAVMSFESTEDGFLAQIFVQSGTEGVLVGTPIAIVVESNASVEAFKNYKLEGSVKPSPTAKETESGPIAKQAIQKPQTEAASTDKQTPVHESVSSTSNGQVFASPRARAAAKEKGIDLSTIAGSGPEVLPNVSRIIEADVIRAPVTSQITQPNVSQKASSPSYQDITPASLPGTAYTDIPLSNLRKVIASRLTESKTTIPHYYLTVECQVDKLLQMRKEFNDMSNGEFKLSVNDFIIKAAALACMKVPEANSQWMGNSIRRYHSCDVNVAISTEAGLYSPLIKGVEGRGLTAISQSVKDLAEKAKVNKLSYEEIQSGTFTISNLGMFGIKHFTAVINPPQACILAVGGLDKKIVERTPTDANSDKYQTVSTITCTLSCDHRVVDGAVGATWLQVYKSYIEDPLKMLL